MSNPLWRRSRATLALAAALALLLSGCASGAPSATSATMSATATTPLNASPMSTPSATATLTAYAPPCATSQLRLAFVRGGVAMGHAGLTYQFTNTSPPACSLKGFASARLLDASGQPARIKVEPVFQQYLWPELPENTIELASGGSAYFEAQVQDGPLAPGDVCVVAATTIFYPPRNTTGLASHTQVSTCNGIVYLSPIVAAESDL